MINSLFEIEKYFNAEVISHPCGYFPDKISTAVVFYCSSRLPSELVDYILSAGYRRCGNVYYRNICHQCNACVSYRIKINEFIPNRSQRRNEIGNSDLKVSFKQLNLTENKKLIYRKYFRERHSCDCFHGDIMNDNQIDETMISQMFSDYGNSAECEVSESGRIVSFSTIDFGAKSMSAVYTAYDPFFIRRAPGIFAVLSMIEKCRENGFEYLYLGFYIENHPKMHYKSSFRNSEILKECQWEDFQSL
ncbi:MAG: arginyltransferase [Spirochaetes bacterium]|nr:arginyltransferase [Spirochaetota bacterium]